MNYPKISIVTPSFNQGQFIEQTILSVINQGYPNLEYIIIDGGSTDNTIEIIKKYAPHLSYWVSEKDKGQADAINKGLKYCTGEIFNWINSDDYLAEGALKKVATSFEAGSAGIVAGAVQNFDNTGLLELYISKNLKPIFFFDKEADYVYHQPGVWLRLNIMKKVGHFRIDYHYCFDQEYMLRYLLMNSNVNYIPNVLAFFREHEASKSVAQADMFFLDFNKMYKEFYKSQKGSMLSVIAKRKSKEFEWPLLQQSIGQKNYGKTGEFFAALYIILKDPLHRLNKSNLGWLKHILFRK